MLGYFFNTFPISTNSSKLYPAPVVFDGEFRINHLVLFVMLYSNIVGVSLKLSSSLVSIVTGVPPAKITISG